MDLVAPFLVLVGVLLIAAGALRQPRSAATPEDRDGAGPADGDAPPPSA